MLLAKTAEGLRAPPDNKATLATTLNQGALEAAATALRADYCPGIGG
jgi:hypothetical protein